MKKKKSPVRRKKTSARDLPAKALARGQQSRVRGGAGPVVRGYIGETEKNLGAS